MDAGEEGHRSQWMSLNAKVQLRANEINCERSELPKIARLLQRIVR